MKRHNGHGFHNVDSVKGGRTPKTCRVCWKPGHNVRTCPVMKAQEAKRLRRPTDVKWSQDFEGRPFLYLARWKRPDDIGPHFDMHQRAEAEKERDRLNAALAAPQGEGGT